MRRADGGLYLPTLSQLHHPVCVAAAMSRAHYSMCVSLARALYTHYPDHASGSACMDHQDIGPCFGTTLLVVRRSTPHLVVCSREEYARHMRRYCIAKGVPLCTSSDATT